jgi:hypothetical protein
MSLAIDHLLLAVIIIPILVLGLKFITAPINLPFLSRVSTYVAPLGAIPIFFF